MNPKALDLAVIGAGPVGLALAVHAARALPQARITLFDARAEQGDVSRDARTLALSLASVQQLERLGAWSEAAAQPILEVHVSQHGLSLAAALGARLGRRLGIDLGDAALRIRAADEGVPMLGAVLGYCAIVEPLQRAWTAATARDPQRLSSRFSTPVAALKNRPGGVEVDAGIVESFDLAVVAEGGVFADQARKALVVDYRQTAWVGKVGFEHPPSAAAAGVAFERFTRHGPAALLPLRDGRAALVWCVGSDDGPVRKLSDAQRIAVLNELLHRDAGRIVSITALDSFALGLNAERTLTDGRIVRIGNAAQTLHPVAGQGLNLGLRDAFDLVRALARDADVEATLRKLEWQRVPDRWAMIATTDFLARSFTWALPGAASARAIALGLLQRAPPLKSALARQMMHGLR
ncbi:MAG: FAD-dependent monooxygenase [Burkholderiaceae bacterium]